MWGRWTSTAKRGLASQEVSAASYSRAPKTIRDVLVDRLRPRTYSLTRPPPPLSPHSSLIEFLSLLLFRKIKPPVNAGTRTTSLWVTRETGRSYSR